ncbi:MAG: helix-turn-helix domain-containing protein [Candidatus Micrarchaeota archaeon]
MNRKCTVFKTARFIGKRWTLLILLELYKGKSRRKRYSELKERLINITPKILSTRLKELEKEGLVEKRITADKFPIKSEYSLTASGRDFISVIRGIKKWALKWDKGSVICENRDCKHCEF